MLNGTYQLKCSCGRVATVKRRTYEKWVGLGKYECLSCIGKRVNPPKGRRPTLKTRKCSRCGKESQVIRIKGSLCRSCSSIVAHERGSGTRGMRFIPEGDLAKRRWKELEVVECPKCLQQRRLAKDTIKKAVGATGSLRELEESGSLRGQQVMCPQCAGTEPETLKKIADSRSSQPIISSVARKLYDGLREAGVAITEEGEQTRFGPYSWDGLMIDSAGRTVLVEVQGDYWHRRTEAAAKDSRKLEWGVGNLQEHRFLYLWESDIVKSWPRVLESVVTFLAGDAQVSGFVREMPAVCHQYEMRERFRPQDEKDHPELFNRSLSECSFAVHCGPITPEIANFIRRYEWLRTIPPSPKWVFTSRLDGVLVGVIVLGEPSGGRPSKVEAQVHRGANASFAPRNHSSKFLMWCIRWMLRNTEKRSFIGYADPEAGERGVIYRACNFTEVPGYFGSKFMLVNQNWRRGLPFSPQSLNRTGVFKQWFRLRYGKNPDKSWFNAAGFKVSASMPSDVRSAFNQWKASLIEQSERLGLPAKKKFRLSFEG